MRPERAFLAVAIPLGLTLGLALPPAAAPDEGYHLGRVWALSEGRVRLPRRGTPPVTIPRSIPDLYRSINGVEFPPRPHPRSLEELRTLLARPVEPAPRVGFRMGGAYPPLGYLPPLAGVALGRALSLPIGAVVYLGRATSLGAWIALAWLAIRWCPVRRWSLALVALTPMSIATAASISADPFTTAVALLFLAAVMRAGFASGERASRAALLAVVGAAGLLGFAKAGYWALAGAVLVIPAVRCGGPRRWLGLVGAVAACAILPSALWLLEVRAAGIPADPGADAMAQLGWIASHPLAFVGVLAHSFATTGVLWYLTFIGVLGLLIVRLPMPAYAAYGGALVYAAIADGPQPPALVRWRRGLLLAVAASCALTILLLVYAGSNPPGAPNIAGVQGRYFLPLAPAVLLGLPSLPHPLPRAGRIGLVTVAVTCGIAAFLGVMRSYYVF